MKLLLDTHAFLWSITPGRLSDAASAAFLDLANTLYLSAASYWEICIKISLGKLSLPVDWPRTIDRALDINGIEWLPIKQSHCLDLITLPYHHRDPFDRLLIAQARVEGLAILSADPNISRYEVPVIW